MSGLADTTSLKVQVKKSKTLKHRTPHPASNPEQIGPTDDKTALANLSVQMLHAVSCRGPSIPEAKACYHPPSPNSPKPHSKEWAAPASTGNVPLLVSVETAVLDVRRWLGFRV